MKKKLILMVLVLLQFLMILKSAMSEYIEPGIVLYYYIFILLSAYVFIALIRKKLTVLIIVILYCLILFKFLFNPKIDNFILLADQSVEAFLELPGKNISVIEIISQPLHKKNYYRFSIYKKEIINDFLLSLKTCKEIDNTGIHMWDYYAITFIEDNGSKYSIVLKKNCAIPNNEDSVFCNVLFIKSDPSFHVFDTIPDYEGVAFYKCNGIVPLLNRNIETLIEKNPEKLHQIIN